MELADIKSRDDLRIYWQKALNRPVWNAAEVEAERQSLLLVAKELSLTDWERYLEGREGYGIDYAGSVTRLSVFIDWARTHRENIEACLFAYGLFNLGVMQAEFERTDDALRTYSELVDNFKQDSDKAIVSIVAKALFNAANNAGDSGDPASMSQYLDELRQMAKAHDEPAIREQLAKALFNVSFDARKSEDSASASQYLDELRQMVKAHDESAIREPLAKALFNYSILLEKSKNFTDAYGVCVEAENLLKQFVDEATKPLREMLAIRKNRLRKALDMPEEDLQKPKPFEQAPADVNPTFVLPTVTTPAAPQNESSQATRTQKQISDVMARARMIQAYENVIAEFKEVKERFLGQMDRRKKRVGRFLDSNGRFAKDASVLMVLRQWNSYTPIIVDGQESDRGGGYFVRHKNVGLVIDPGYNFIELFHEAGCKIVDISHVAITHEGVRNFV